MVSTDNEFFCESNNLEGINERLSVALGRPEFKAYELDLFLKILHESAAANERVEVPAPQPHRIRLGARPKNSNYVVKVKTATLLSGALVLDAMLTSGFSAGALAASGMDLQVVTRLSRENGALCNFITLEKSERTAFPIPIEHVVSATSSKPCRHQELTCEHRNGDICGINKTATSRNVHHMAEKGLVVLSDDKITSMRA